MTLRPGTRLGAYDVVAAIGKGGMGEVFRANDSKLRRDVALKVLPELFASDPQRLSRFEREAEVLASLNHPNIAAIHGLEEAHGIQALVLELVEGPTLAERIADGPLAVDEALPIASQIVDALEAAHEHGVIHRDLKPANIKIREDGTVKVLDFGLAKVLTESTATDRSTPLTRSLAATQAGVTLGTAAYMAPEQAKGRPVDKRADIWAFGCVLYEMLTARAPFLAESIWETIAKTLDAEPDWQALPANTPPPLTRLLRRCLQKDPRERLRDIGDARIEIREAMTTVAAKDVGAVPAAPDDLDRGDCGHGSPPPWLSSAGWPRGSSRGLAL
jgi:serine/threonine protein kinase